MHREPRGSTAKTRAAPRTFCVWNSSLYSYIRLPTRLWREQWHSQRNQSDYWLFSTILDWASVMRDRNGCARIWNHFFAPSPSCVASKIYSRTKHLWCLNAYKNVRHAIFELGLFRMRAVCWLFSWGPSMLSKATVNLLSAVWNIVSLIALIRCRGIAVLVVCFVIKLASFWIRMANKVWTIITEVLDNKVKMLFWQQLLFYWVGSYGYHLCDKTIEEKYEYVFSEEKKF